MKMIKQLFRSEYKNKIINKINKLQILHDNLLHEMDIIKYSNTNKWVKHIMKRERLMEDINLLKSLL